MAPSPELLDVTCELDVLVPMRDGVALCTDIYRPVIDELVPVLVVRSLYGKSVDTSLSATGQLPEGVEPAGYATWVYRTPEELAARGYIVVVQEVRGTFKSIGDFYPFANDVNDGYDTVEWAAALPGSNGRVGMYGYSYLGATQWLAAGTTPPHLATIVPVHTGADYYEGWAYQSGALSLGFIKAWTMFEVAYNPAEQRGDHGLLREFNEARENLDDWFSYRPLKRFPLLHPDDPVVAKFYFDWLDHPTYDEYWQQLAPRERYDRVIVPALHIGGWYDMFLTGAFENFTGMRERGGSDVARANQRLIVGPWTHGNWSRHQPSSEQLVVDFGPAADNCVNELQLAWFERWLKDQHDESEDAPPVQLFIMGENRWLAADDWPVPGTEYRELLLASSGSANTAEGDGRLEFAAIEEGGARTDTYRYDPTDPVPSIGGHNPILMGPSDQTPVEARDDVLVYSTEPLEESLVVAGPITVRLFASSSASDTDFTAALVDVEPDGRPVLLNHGIVRAPYRVSLSDPSPIEPGRVYEYEIHIWPTGHAFRRGHRIRLEISSSSFPGYDANPNTGEPFGETANTLVAEQTIWHNTDHPSALVLPVLPPHAQRWVPAVR